MIFKNILIKRECLHWKRTFYLQPLFWIVLIAFITQIYISFNFSTVFGRIPLHGPDDRILYYYFNGFHIYLHVLLPMILFLQINSTKLKHQLETYRTLPITNHQIFLWLFTKYFIIGLLPLLLIYFPLYINYSWLYDWEDQITDKFNILYDLVFLFLLFLPWIRIGRWIILIWIPAILFMVLPIYLGYRVEELTGYGSILHPLVTLKYFVISTIWVTAITIYFGTNQTRNNALNFLLVLMCTLVAEFIMNLIFFPEIRSLYTLEYLIGMFFFYVCSVGYFWIALKWNLFIYLLRIKRFH